MSWSCPFHASNSLFMSLTFSVCSLHFPCVSRSFVASHFPTCPVVPIGFLVLCVPFIPPALPLFAFLSFACPFQFPFVSLLFPAAFLSCRLPIFSPHLLALPCVPPLLPNISRKTQCFSSFFAIRTSKNTEFFGTPQTSKEPAGGIEPGTPVLRPAPRRLRLGIRRRAGGGYPLSSLRCPTRRAMSADYLETAEPDCWLPPFNALYRPKKKSLSLYVAASLSKARRADTS